MFDEMVTYVIIAFIVGTCISLFFRILFAYLNRKQSDVFMAEMEAKMKSLNLEAQKRTGDLQEAMDMISKEHSDIVRYLGDREIPDDDPSDKAKKE